MMISVLFVSPSSAVAVLLGSGGLKHLKLSLAPPLRARTCSNAFNFDFEQLHFSRSFSLSHSFAVSLFFLVSITNFNMYILTYVHGFGKV